MQDRLKVDLDGVPKTLLLPLWGRAEESRKTKPLLMDETAVRIVNALDYDFAALARNMSRISQLAWVVRCLHADRTIREFLARHTRGTIVNLGCGLDTTLERVDNGQLRWYDLDLPEVIELRNKLVPANPRRNTIARSLLDRRWLDEIAGSDGLLVLSMGVLYYFQEPQLRDLFGWLADAFPACKMFFDACSAFGLKTANKRVIRDGGMTPAANLQWSLERAAELETWDSRIHILEAYPLFRGTGHGWSLKERWGTFLSDRLRVMSMIHLQLGPA